MVLAFALNDKVFRNEIQYASNSSSPDASPPVVIPTPGPAAMLQVVAGTRRRFCEAPHSISEFTCPLLKKNPAEPYSKLYVVKLTTQSGKKCILTK
jgi:hypothetical protein